MYATITNFIEATNLTQYAVITVIAGVIIAIISKWIVCHLYEVSVLSKCLHIVKSIGISITIVSVVVVCISCEMLSDDITLIKYYHIATIIGVLIALASAIIIFLSYNDTKNRKKVEKAVELAKYYADIILPESVYMRELIKIIDKDSIYIDTVRNTKLEAFTLLGLKEVFKSKYEIIKDMWESISFDDVIEAKIQCCDNNKNLIKILELKKYKNSKNCHQGATSLIKIFNIKMKHQKGEAQKETIVHDYLNYQRDLTNKLEWFAMNFMEKIADETVVYESLHQTYFKIVERLYYYISSLNISGVDKYCTNIVSLYLLWQTRRNGLLTKEKKEIKEKIIRRKKTIK